MAANYREIRETVFQRFPYMRSSAFERRMLFERAVGPKPKSVYAYTSLVPEALAD